MIAIIIIILFIIFDSALRNYIIGTFSSLGSFIHGVGGNSGGLTPSDTNFTAYDCSSSVCSTFGSLDYMWAVDYNGLNESDFVNTTLEFAGSSGNYSVLVYPIRTGSEVLCSNITQQTTLAKSTYLLSGYNYTLYFSVCG